MLKNLFKEFKSKRQKKRELQKKLDILNGIIDDVNERIKTSEDMTTKSYLIIMQLGFLDERDELLNKIQSNDFS